MAKHDRGIVCSYGRAICVHTPIMSCYERPEGTAWFQWHGLNESLGVSWPFTSAWRDPVEAFSLAPGCLHWLMATCYKQIQIPNHQNFDGLMGQLNQDPDKMQVSKRAAHFALCSWLVNFLRSVDFHGRPAGKSRTASWSQRSVRNLRKAALPSGYRPAGARFEARACKMRDVQLAYDDVAHGVMVLSMSILLSNHREMDTLILMAELPRVTQRWSNYRNDWTV